MTRQQGISRQRPGLRNSLSKYILNPFRRMRQASPWVFDLVTTALVLALFINILSQSLSEWGGLGLAWGVFLFLVVMGVVGVLVYQWSENKRLAADRDYTPIDIPNPVQHRGLIALFSNEQTLAKAVQHHAPTLTNCWLIVTPQLVAKATAERERLESQNVHVDLRPLPMLYDTKGCYEIVRNVFEHEALACGLQKQDIIADITGGTKPMTMGMVLACLEQGADIEHVPTEYDAEGKPRGPLPPIQIDVPGRSAEEA